MFGAAARCLRRACQGGQNEPRPAIPGQSPGEKCRGAFRTAAVGAGPETAGLVRGRRRSEMSNPDNYAVIKSSAKEQGPAGSGTRLHIRKRGASNWALPVPETSFDSGDTTWEESLASTVKRSGESVVFSAKDLERLRAEAQRILHPIVKNSRMAD